MQKFFPPRVFRDFVSQQQKDKEEKIRTKNKKRKAQEINGKLLWNLMQFQIENEKKYFFYDPLKVVTVVNYL